MATTGTQSDVVSRLKSVIPASWFPNPNAPNEFALLQAFSNVASYIYSLAVFAKLQTRIATASGFFLDLMAFDFFGRSFQRGAGESDNSFRAGIKTQLLAARATRPGLTAVLTQLTGTPPTIFYPAESTDTGGYGITSTVFPGFVMGYGQSGLYGSILMPFQALVTAFRPSGSGIPDIPGYGSTSAAPGFFIAGYGITGEYADIENIIGSVTDAEIYAAVANNAPVGVIPWTRIANPAGAPPPGVATISGAGVATSAGTVLSTFPVVISLTGATATTAAGTVNHSSGAAVSGAAVSTTAGAVTATHSAVITITGAAATTAAGAVGIGGSAPELDFSQPGNSMYLGLF